MKEEIEMVKIIDRVWYCSRCGWGNCNRYPFCGRCWRPRYLLLAIIGFFAGYILGKIVL